MTSEWEDSTLGDVLTLQRGMDLPVQERKGGKHPIVASTGVVGFHNEAPVKAPGVVIGRSGSIGGGQFIDQDFWPLNTTLWVKDFKGNDPRYCYYLLKSIDFSSMNAGSGVPTLNRNHLHPMRVAKPPVSVQKSISGMLGCLDDRITLLHETNATLEAIAQALFKSWFVDFDPVRAKADGKLPEGIDAATAALFPDAFEETELGLVPRGWDVVSLNEYCKIFKGCSYKGAGLSDNAGAYMLNLGCFNAPRVFAFENIKRYTGEYKERHRVSAGDLIVANTDMTQVRAILGRPLIVPNGLQDSFISHHVFRLQLLNSDEPSMRNFLFFTLQQSEFRNRAIGYATGTTVLALPKEVLEGFKLTRPSNEVLAAFNEVTNPLLDSIQENEIKVNALTNLRDTLLPRLISGQLRIADAEAEPEKAKA